MLRDATSYLGSEETYSLFFFSFLKEYILYPIQNDIMKYQAEEWKKTLQDILFIYCLSKEQSNWVDGW